MTIVIVHSGKERKDKVYAVECTCGCAFRCHRSDMGETFDRNEKFLTIDCPECGMARWVIP